MSRKHYKAQSNPGMWVIIGLVLISTVTFAIMLTLQS